MNTFSSNFRNIIHFSSKYFRGDFLSTGIVCEFNPFHNGHKYLVEKAREITGEPIVAVMSGSFTQRGEVALTDKFSRARAALLCGVDLVIELPSVYAVSNAERFARCGVNILSSFSDMNYLAFGCESDDITKLKKAATAHTNPEIQALVAMGMKNGGYYPKVLEESVKLVYGEEISEILSTPNNVLAVEYIRNLDNSIQPVPIKRMGVSHDSDKTSGGFASASKVRELMHNGEDVSGFLPFVPDEITSPEKLETAILYKLRSMTLDEIAALPDVTEGLENRIYSALREHNSTEEIITAIKTKRYTHARIRRIITSALLGITEKMQNTEPKYVRVLGFTPQGATLLKNCNLPVITSVAKDLKLSENIQALLERDVFATDTAALAYPAPKKCGMDFTTQIIKQ